MAAARPFSDGSQLTNRGAELWWSLDREDWLEAFSHHPRIGEDPEALRVRYANTASWSSGEQSGMAAASDEILQALAAGNRAYGERFGYVFLVCASGKSAAEMLAILQSRIDNEPSAELRIAAGEQAKITVLRLAKLTDPSERSEEPS